MDNDEQMTALFGPAAPQSPYKKGETIKFKDEKGTEQSGLITWVTAAHRDAKDRIVPLTYVVWIEGALFPAFVYPSDIITE
jgi:hypothetical protein